MRIPMCAPLPPKEWEVLAVSRSKTGQYYMELCNGSACLREPIEPYDAAILHARMSMGASIYASELPKEELPE